MIRKYHGYITKETRLKELFPSINKYDGEFEIPCSTIVNAKDFKRWRTKYRRCDCPTCKMANDGGQKIEITVEIKKIK